ncbi:MAG: pyrroline-5-carboxylate reductase [Candidatus Lambdaproteobacteria bacterium RIFOXYD1_FULL_56_27]|uniref:Pyrroline-5-carboxylate reductase n=1 Tax=Candidatus Lambdaproteobacteria bacterium RIFOXYD2_FULL_56_26 TaxID=1817773 RepID=A0A1F6GMV8_9PROT|nr:MAG: pyrroline-5-carboxylate reductase [Candidatus Lambdaproteobacteria bacterium RIFOXYD2_FULL_56_26]OGH05586.1 MAG: pyrroline-5-carboxylate reductase [Candidatus Lambdaproteobacteria bacterium RIFOXYC1_FULL_56_13]OGH08545.1 MAG: pyrroline-5-carboxylate reductase [Candidatus Lambdaproteobacteria bacterium RIFOXYD1_FULL_56_27]
MKTALIVGCGNMGSAIVSALLEKEIFPRESLLIVEKQENQHTLQLEGMGVRIFKTIEEVKETQELVILAIKPQDAVPVMERLKPKVNAQSLVISIMAGITLKAMEKVLTEPMLIRSMPNTPCAIHQGMTVFCGSPKVTASHKAIAQVILGGMGKAIEVEHEGMIDSATAISGSGPAYLFYLAEAMTEAAKAFGFSAGDATMLANQTLLGASLLLEQSEEGAEGLKKRVTSKGGTTEAALRTFDAKGIKQSLTEGFKAAKARSEELGRG